MDIISDLISMVKRFGTEVVFSKYYGIYPATVKDNKDPVGMGRVRVISPIFGFVDKPAQVWVAPAFSDMIYDPPELGSELWIQFISGNLARPVYVGSRKIPGDARFGEFQQSGVEPKKRAIKTKYGHIISFDDTSGSEQIQITTPKGQKITLSESDGIIIEGSSNVKITSSQVTITGGQLTVAGTVTPSTGPFNCLPNCIFSGVSHSGDKVSGT